MSMVLQLIKNIYQEKATMSSIMKQAITISSLLDVDNITQWLESETNGYKDPNNVPSYRRILVEYQTDTDKGIVGLLKVYFFLQKSNIFSMQDKLIKRLSGCY